MKLVVGYFPGLIGEITRLHGAYYTKHANFDVNFEASIARDVANLCNKLDQTKSEIWSYIDSDKGNRVVATLTIEEIEGEDNTAHLRWFVADETYHGYGMGRRLMKAAMDYCKHANFHAVTLATFSGLDAAKKLYLDFGFKLTEEFPSQKWGKEVLEQHYSWSKE